MLCAVTASSKQVSARVPQRLLAQKWLKKVEELLLHQKMSQSEVSWHFAPDDMLVTTQRMSKLAAKDAVVLALWQRSHLHQVLFHFASDPYVKSKIHCKYLVFSLDALTFLPLPFPTSLTSLLHLQGSRHTLSLAKAS